MSMGDAFAKPKFAIIPAWPKLVGHASSVRGKFPPIQLTDRDRNIIRQIYRHRLLRSSQIVALVGGSRQQVLRRLHLLFHHGYVDVRQGYKVKRHFVELSQEEAKAREESALKLLANKMKKRPS
jgi:hypothetical protein